MKPRAFSSVHSAVVAGLAAAVTFWFVWTGIRDVLAGAAIWRTSSEPQSAGGFMTGALQRYFDYWPHSAPERLLPPRVHEFKLLESRDAVEAQFLQTFTPLIHRSAWSFYKNYAVGDIVSGRWWQKAPVNCVLPRCPCAAELPCFQECDDRAGCAAASDGLVDPHNPFANALQMRGQTPAGALETAAVPFTDTLVLVDLCAAMPVTDDSGNPNAAKLGRKLEHGRGEKSPPAALAAIGHAGQYYLPPENNSTTVNQALEAVQTIAAEFQELAKPGDRLRVLGFDEQLGEGSWRSAGPAVKGGGGWDELQAVFAGVEGKEPQAAQARGFFPIAGTNTDLPEVLVQAAQLLRVDPLSGTSDQHLLLITNGLTSGAGTGGVNSPPGYALHLQSLERLVNGTAPQVLLPLGIKLHVMLVGAKVSPHTVGYPSIDNPGHCMDAAEARLRNYPEVLWRSWKVPYRDPNEFDFAALRSGRSGRYIQPNVFLYFAAKITGGSWIPLRPPCPAAAPAKLNQACARGAGSDALPRRFPAGAEQLAKAIIVTDQELAAAGAMDGDGRVICDPGGGDYASSREAIRRIFHRKK